MKLRLPRLRSTNLLALFAAVLLMIANRGQAEPLPLDRAIRLALAHSTTSAIANADVQRAFASYRELRNNYLPQLFVGAGLGYTYGNPLAVSGTAPSLANVVAQSTVFNLAQRQFMNAAKTEWRGFLFLGQEPRQTALPESALWWQ